MLCLSQVSPMMLIRTGDAQAHEAIREDPMPEKKERQKPDEKRVWKAKKLTYDERKANLKVSLPPMGIKCIAICACAFQLLLMTSFYALQKRLQAITAAAEEE